jgi:hypothetical protein
VFDELRALCDNPGSADGGGGLKMLYITPEKFSKSGKLKSMLARLVKVSCALYIVVLAHATALCSNLAITHSYSFIIDHTH